MLVDVVDVVLVVVDVVLVVDVLDVVDGVDVVVEGDVVELGAAVDGLDGMDVVALDSISPAVVVSDPQAGAMSATAAMSASGADGFTNATVPDGLAATLA